MLVLAAFLLTSAVFFGLWWYCVDRPIRDLIRIMKAAPSQNFLNRAVVRGEGVMGSLAQSFNRLLEQITTLDAFKIQTERQLAMVEEEFKYKSALEEKNGIIERTNQEIGSRLKELSLLYEFSREVTSSLELEDLYNFLETFLGEKLGFHEFTFLVFEEVEQCLVVRAAQGFQEHSKIRGMKFRAGEGITGRVLEKGELVSIPDTALNKDYLYYKGEKREDGSFLSIPVVFQKKVIGVFNMFRRGRGQFSDEEIRFLNTLCIALAIAIENAKLYSRTKELSVRDELTQLYNRRHFQEMLPLEIKRAKRFQKSLTLLMIDIDHFKKFNDRYGHLTGDEILKEFVHVVGSRIREVDFFGRFGGEEFVLILPGTPREDGIRVAEKITTMVRNHKFLGGIVSGKSEASAPPLTVSIGVASSPEDGETMEDLLDSADIALYEAKRNGRDRVAVYEKPPSLQHRHQDAK